MMNLDGFDNSYLHLQAVKLVADGTSVRRKTIYSIALRKFGKQLGSESGSDSPKPQRE